MGAIKHTSALLAGLWPRGEGVGLEGPFDNQCGQPDSVWGSGPARATHPSCVPPARARRVVSLTKPRKIPAPKLPPHYCMIALLHARLPNVLAAARVHLFTLLRVCIRAWRAPVSARQWRRGRSRAVRLAYDTPPCGRTVHAADPTESRKETPTIGIGVVCPLCVAQAVRVLL